MRIAIVGAGSIGCYVGGRLQAFGHDVSYIGRGQVGQAISAHGLTVSDSRGWTEILPGNECVFTTDIGATRSAEVVLVTVKSAATSEIALSLAPHLASEAVVVSLQNGVRNTDELAKHLRHNTVASGMVGFNVAQVAPAHFHQATQGRIAVSAQAGPIAKALSDSGLPTDTHEDMRPVQWGKLLLNLNNAVNGLSGLPLKEELAQRDFRRVLAAAQKEALRLLRAAGQTVTSPIPAPIAILPWVLGAPDAVFTRLASQLLAVDPAARSSMLDDITAGKPTEIDYINGEIVDLAARLGRNAPVNAPLVRLIHEIEHTGQRQWSGKQLLAAIDRK
ncbi:2-dehydropantoate 2-reductase [Mycobacteroides chelonae]|uniref:2-dehydropantoate 2-reductase n=1 Tax=Mycobacteroides chelonae TaxID=1774 RepID=UPI000993FFD0|nr:2-dehydropantoate 2-reductase [Mycobacteroides chelonae]